VGWLVARARRDRLRATEAARLERDAREQRERLIATVSHDLATPLAAIRGTVQFAQRFGADAPLDLDRLLVRLNTAATRASWLVQTLSDAKSLEDGGLSLTLSEVDMRELVAPVVHMLDRMSERHPLVLAVPPHPVPVRCDSDRLQRVVENLLTNAIKYSPDGGTIEVTLAQDGRDAVLTVRDHGIGISRDAAPHLFDRHYRAPEASNAASGLGLGLHIAAEIVRRHEGTIQAGPALPNGSVFTVRIPLARMEVAGLAPGASERRAHV
jgi:signal transduction histidine kinase